MREDGPEVDLNIWKTGVEGYVMKFKVKDMKLTSHPWRYVPDAHYLRLRFWGFGLIYKRYSLYDNKRGISEGLT